MRGVLAALLAAALASGCMPGVGYPGFGYPGLGYPGPGVGYSPPYYREYDAPYYGNWGGGSLSRDEARDIAREQEDQRRRLEREQAERRQDLRDRQAERRESKQADDTWKQRNVNWQKQ
jgi:hypothetical protein